MVQLTAMRADLLGAAIRISRRRPPDKNCLAATNTDRQQQTQYKTVRKGNRPANRNLLADTTIKRKGNRPANIDRKKPTSGYNTKEEGKSTSE